MDFTKVKELGNQHYAKKEYKKARDLYSQGLEIDPNNEILLANRSAACLMLENFQAALEDAQKVLMSHPNHFKAIIRASKAFCGLSRYREAATTLKSLNDSDISVADKMILKNLHAKVVNYIKQSEKGEYDFLALLKSYNTETFHDVADYFGPLEIVNIPGKGRGVVATKDIQQGQLLILSKAFAISFENNMANCRFIKDVVEVLHKTPEKKKVLYNLYAGPKLGFLDPEVSDQNSLIDVHRILSILDNNGFSCFGTGLWIEPSFVNNDCGTFNSIFFDYGNVMVIRAVQPIKVGQEVLVSYTKNRYSYFERKKVLWDAYAFECACDLCQLQKSEDPKLMKQIGALLEYFRYESTSCIGALNIDEVEIKMNLLKRLCAGYSDYYFRMFTQTSIYVLARAYDRNLDLLNSTKILEDLATNTELNLTHKMGVYGLGSNFCLVLADLLTNLCLLKDTKKGKKYFPMILKNLEITHGKVGVEGYKFPRPLFLKRFIDDISV